MPLDPKHLRDRYGALRTRQAQWNRIYTQIGRFVSPWRDEINRVATEGSKRTEYLFDGTAPHSVSIATAAIHGTLTSSSTRWFGLTFRDQSLLDRDGAGTWLEEASNLLFAAYNQSNLDSEVPLVYGDLLAFGTACMFVDEAKSYRPRADFKGFTFQSYAPGTYVIAEDEEGRVDTVFREFKLSVRGAAKKWGLQKLSRKAQDLFKANKLEDELSLLHAVFPREGVSAENVTVFTPATKLPWVSAYMEVGEDFIISEGGYHEMRYLAPRWQKASGEVYGRSPGMLALPDIRTLNRAVELRLKAWAKAIDPPLMVRDRGVLGKVSAAAAAINSVRDMDSIKELLTSAKFDVANFSEEQLRDAIRKAFYIDQIQLPPMQGTPVSATEASIRYETMQRILGPAIGRVVVELLSPLIFASVRMMLRRKALPPLPASLIDGRGTVQLDVEYEGPLARAQRASDIDAVTRVYSILGPIKEIEPDVMASIKHKEVGRYVAEAASFPKSLIYSKTEQEAMDEAKLEAQQNANETADAQANAQAIGQLAPALKVAQEAAAEEAMPSPPMGGI